MVVKTTDFKSAKSMRKHGTRDSSEGKRLETSANWTLGSAAYLPAPQPLWNSLLSKVVPFRWSKGQARKTCCNWLWTVQTISWGKHHFIFAFPESVKNMFVLAFFSLSVIFSIPQFERIRLHLVTKMRAGSKLTPWLRIL